MNARVRSTFGESCVSCAASVATPIGPITVAAREGAIESVAFMDRWTASGSSIDGRTAHAAPREPREFDLVLAERGAAFQRRVLGVVRGIPFGQTMTYAEVARRAGNGAASRAVAVANARNPWAIGVPCHRVVGANGRLTGYGGGLWRKEWLLGHESAMVGAVLIPPCAPGL